MEIANLPVEKAIEPHEEARQPSIRATNMTPKPKGQPTKKIITFANDTDTENDTPSQSSSAYKDVLSQPAANISHRARLEWLQQRRTGGLWAQCNTCACWRKLPHVLDSHELPAQWICSMNPDPAYASCSVPEDPIPVRDEEDLIHSEYAAGSLVWAHMNGYPWWPAMVDDCPDTEMFYWLDGFSDIPTHYHVVFFDSADVTRAWLVPERLRPFVANKKTFKRLLDESKYKTRLQAAVKQADEAAKLPLRQRFEQCSFIARYKGPINPPKVVTEKELRKHQISLKRKFNIDFEVSLDSDDSSEPKSNGTKRNVIIVGKRKPGGQARAPPTTIIDRDETDAVANSKVKKVVQVVEPKGSETVCETEKMETEVNTETTTDTIKQGNSLTVQVGSTNDSATFEETFDNDTSKTYVPENGTKESTQSTITDSVTRYCADFEVVIASPSSVHSDDFEY